MIAKKTAVAAAKVEPPTLAFATAADFEAWVAAHPDDPVGMWLLIAKKGSGIESVTYAEALQVALCYGWIDGRARKGDDDTSYRQRFCPRRPRSVWSDLPQSRWWPGSAWPLTAQCRVCRRTHRSRSDAAGGHRRGGTGQG